jgi:hypothetical protein
LVGLSHRFTSKTAIGPAIANSHHRNAEGRFPKNVASAAMQTKEPRSHAIKTKFNFFLGSEDFNLRRFALGLSSISLPMRQDVQAEYANADANYSIAPKENRFPDIA